MSAACLAPTPTQRRVEDELFHRDRARPSFAADLGPALRDLLEVELAPLVADRQPDAPLVVAKRALAEVHTCEGLHLASRAAPFAWSPSTARGTVAHKAVELAVLAESAAPPIVLVDWAIERLIDADGSGISTWLAGAPAAELAEVRGAATDWLVKFQDTFPTPRPGWRPRVESSLSVELCGRRVVLRGKVDLALGRADGCTARVLIIDFKTGAVRPVHAEDLRFYALLEAIRVGVPPYRLATFSLESGTWAAEDVDEDVLLAAVRRTVDGVRAMLQLEEGRSPARRPGPACRWCPQSQSCPALEVVEAAADAEDGAGA